LTCTFASDDQPQSTRNLIDVATEQGSIGAVRLHLLKTHWLGSARAAISDPTPVLTIGPMPEWPQSLATAVQQLLAALPTIAIYALLAAAYSLIYGLIGRINLAFGELAMLAAYAAFLGFSMISASDLTTAIAAAVAVGIATCLIYGYTLGRIILQPMTRITSTHTGQHVLIATIGLSIALSELLRLTQGTGVRWISPILSRPFAIARSGDFLVTVTMMALIVTIIAISGALLTVVCLERSGFGRHWRASSDDPEAASLLGIDQTDVLIKTVLLASALAGLGGVLMTLFYGGAGYAGGLALGIKALMAAIVGGIGSVPGALLGALLIGVSETLWSSAFRIEYREAALFTILAIILAIRPQGILGIDDLHHKRT
jgi:branched-chain amino acid transport system permease protein